MKTACSLFGQSSLPYSATSSPICHINLVLASSACFRGAPAFDLKGGEIMRFKKQISNFQVVRVWEFSRKDQKQGTESSIGQWEIICPVSNLTFLPNGSIKILYPYFLPCVYFILFYSFSFFFFGRLKAPEVVFHFFTLSRARGSYFPVTRGYLLITIVLSTFLRSLILWWML